MKTISELRKTLRFNPQEINSQVKYFAENVDIDFDVYLPSKKMNLQREFVWNIDQKRELIWSILMNRNIPRMAMMNVLLTPDNTSGVYQVIDGKQRLSAMIDFYKNKYTLLVDDKEYLFSELPTDYQNVIKGYHFAYYIANEDYGDKFTDQDKIDWFMYINFAGTPQDKAHFDLLK
jgi:uncharacterized protein with ParB-like and HNH nuclease domain